MAVARLYLPETNTSRQLVLALANSLKVMDRHGNVSSIGQRDENWSRVCSKRYAVSHCCPGTCDRSLYLLLAEISLACQLMC